MNYEDLVREGKLKREPKIGFDQVERLLIRARKDLMTAQKLLKTDEEVALAIVYDSMFHAGNALIRAQGYRPGEKKQHVGVIEAVKRTLGEEARTLILKFNDLRVARNQFEYQAVFHMSTSQLTKALEDAKKLLSIVEKYVQELNPQKKFRFTE